ncbi:MAG: hypothetical protein GXP05_01055, partial [Alphaproteobacteria bacterium]|nr:hypothetical protein [Alphaproteobacteria bacterium]
DGSREEIKDRRYTFWNAAGQVVVSRRATGADLARLRARANGINIDSVRHPDSSDATIVKESRITGTQMTITYTNGWSEEIARGIYTLTDQYGRAAIKRPATNSDIKRLRKMAAN